VGIVALLFSFTYPFVTILLFHCETLPSQTKILEG